MKLSRGFYIGNIELRLVEARQTFKFFRHGRGDKGATEFELSFYELLLILASFWNAIRKGMQGKRSKSFELPQIELEWEQNIEAATKLMERYAATKLEGVNLVSSPSYFRMSNVLRYSSFELRYLVPAHDAAASQAVSLPSIALDTRCILSSRDRGPLEVDAVELFWLAVLAAVEIFSTMEVLAEEKERSAGGRGKNFRSYLFGGIGLIIGVPYWVVRAMYRSAEHRHFLNEPKAKPSIDLNADQKKFVESSIATANHSREALASLIDRMDESAREQAARELLLVERESAAEKREKSIEAGVKSRHDALVAEFADEASRLETAKKALLTERRSIEDERKTLASAQQALERDRLAFESDLAKLAEIPKLEATISELNRKNESLLSELGKKTMQSLSAR